MRDQAKAWLRRRFMAAPSDLTRMLGGAPVMVIAPHPDDETIGCGGAILMRTRQGARVDIAFVTDGGADAGAGLDPHALGALRKREAGAAAARLGVGEAQLHFLDHPDGQIAQKRSLIVADFLALLRDCQPAAVFIPHRAERPIDHHRTRAFALEAMRVWGKRVLVLEYGVWCWAHWPWVELKIGLRGWPGAISRRTLSAGFGLASLANFNCRLNLGELAEAKRHAFATYVSQRQSLGRILDGEFLARMLDDFEAFHAYWLNR